MGTFSLCALQKRFEKKSVLSFINLIFTLVSRFSQAHHQNHRFYQRSSLTAIDMVVIFEAIGIVEDIEATGKIEGMVVGKIGDLMVGKIDLVVVVMDEMVEDTGTGGMMIEVMGITREIGEVTGESSINKNIRWLQS